LNPIPKNGQGLIDMRRNRHVPELPVLVSLVGALGFTNVTLQAEAGAAYDWRLVSLLEVEVFADLSVPFPKLLRTLADIAAVVPSRIVLTFSEGACVDCGEKRRVTDFEVFDWFPMVVTPTRAAPAVHIQAWNDGRAVAKKLWAALGETLPIPYDKAMDLVVEIAAENQRCA
jgi:hypothetical protein